MTFNHFTRHGKRPCLFWSNLFELGRNIRSGTFDFFLAQSGNLLFMVSTRKIDLDSILNVVVAAAVIGYSMHELNLAPSLFDYLTYGVFVGCGVMVSYSLLLLISSVSFWTIGSQGMEGGYCTLFEFSRLPREAFSGVSNVVFVWILPTVVISNAPALTFISGLQPGYTLWLLGTTAAWFALSVFVFHRGLRRYASASS
ncbi:MAG: ABC-2 family transporter protein [Candidatus Synoicihabitans palmerolidicus]|nr:ABC-2 family transporter protein [Candidatus Synoicihabitans palmerolidicus]